MLFDIDFILFLYINCRIQSISKPNIYFVLTYQ